MQPPAADEEEIRALLNELDLEQNKTLPIHITKEKASGAIDKLKNDQAPGSDGYPTEW